MNTVDQYQLFSNLVNSALDPGSAFKMPQQMHIFDELIVGKHFACFLAVFKTGESSYTHDTQCIYV